MTDNEIIKALGRCPYQRDCVSCDVNACDNSPNHIMKCARDLINRQKAEIERLNKEVDRLSQCVLYHDGQIADAKAEAIKEFAERIDKYLKRYSHLHKYADEAKHSTEEYADGTPMEMVSVWEVLSLKKWEMVDYETMNTLQDNIETIARERLLTEIEKDFRLFKKEMVGANNG